MNTIQDFQQLSDDYSRIEQAILYLERFAESQPDLGEVASVVGMSEYHFQRMFSRWAGISPKRFLQFLTKESAKDLISRSESLLDTTYEVGLSSPGRLHDLFVTTEAVTPGEYKAKGKGMVIRFGFHQTPFGKALVGITERGICHFGFVQTDEMNAFTELKGAWQSATFIDDVSQTETVIAPIFAMDKGRQAPLHVYLQGTNFQLKVWEALLKIPAGDLISYQQLAKQVGSPGAHRAVGSALAKNPVALLIPCHRVIRSVGAFGNYRYGAARKKIMLGWERVKVT